jgi:hypothetical protein
MGVREISRFGTFLPKPIYGIKPAKISTLILSQTMASYAKALTKRDGNNLT